MTDKLAGQLADREGGPCDCGRDARVLAVLTHLAQPYQETT